MPRAPKCSSRHFICHPRCVSFMFIICVPSKLSLRNHSTVSLTIPLGDWYLLLLISSNLVNRVPDIKKNKGVSESASLIFTSMKKTHTHTHTNKQTRTCTQTNTHKHTLCSGKEENVRSDAGSHRTFDEQLFLQIKIIANVFSNAKRTNILYLCGLMSYAFCAYQGRDPTDRQTEIRPHTHCLQHWLSRDLVPKDSMN